ncbi:hypothetical protein BOTBODRAFT_445313 [Botryobasidium botryosum FD-172 SS1]|uniref:F-box domain-containing protein n=1 Tax=Botryobasidium botryosum (strain FD-172 SS1) TaxID=930990 RepID=A0A067MVA5_BOTB1|nr:hypothetical protein BOTBODRAFT_445313 [Botryobasidium botryosum FD-172 SS1]
MNQMSQSDALVVSAAVPPIQRLADDSLLEIFTELLVTRKRDSTWVSEAFSVCLASVCRRWRGLVHGCSLFWSYIEPEFGKHRDVDLRAKYWVDRARESPLTIIAQIDQPSKGMSDKGAQLIRLTEVLRGCMNRWLPLSVHGYTSRVGILLEQCNGVAPMLKVLDIHASNYIDWSLPPRGFDSLDSVDDQDTDDSVLMLVPFTCTHHLQHDIRVLSTGCLSFTPSFGMAVAYLELNLTASFSTDGLVNVLQSCPNLVKLHLAKMKWVTTPVPLLRLVDLYSDCDQAGDAFLASLQLSALEVVHITRANWSGTMASAVMRIFQSCPHLARIVITQDFSYYQGYYDHPLFLTIPLIILPDATEFHVCGGPPFFPYLRRLILPSISKLRLEAVPYDVALHFISNTSWLESLTLLEIGEQPHDFIHHSFPAPTSLETSLSPNFLGAIYATNLTSLKVTGEQRAELLLRQLVD